MVKVTGDTKLFIKKDDKYIDSGSVSKDTKLELEKTNITYNTEYFKIKDKIGRASCRERVCRVF